MIKEYESIISLRFDELEHYKIRGKQYRELFEEIKILVKKCDSLKRDARKLSQGRGDRNDELKRDERELRIENCVDESRSLNDFNDGSSYVEKENALRKRNVLIYDGFWSSDEDDTNRGLRNPIQEEKDVDFEDGCEPDLLVQFLHLTLLLTLMLTLFLSHLNQLMTMIP